MKPVLLWLIALVVSRDAGAQNLLHRLDVVVDSATYADIAASRFLTDYFAGRDSSIQSVSGERARGTTFYGRNSVLSFRPRDQQHRLDNVVVVLAAERRGSIDALAARASAERVAFDTARYRILRRESIPWRRIWQPVETGILPARAALYVAEPEASFLAVLANSDSLGADDLSRERLLRVSYNPKRMLGDIVAATIALGESDIVLLTRGLVLSGASARSEPMATMVEIERSSLKFESSNSGAGIRRITLALTRQMPGNPTYRFGYRSVLRFGPGPVAVWEF